MSKWTFVLAAATLLAAARREADAARFSKEKLVRAFEFVTDFVFLRNSMKYTGELHGLQIIGAGFSRTGTKSIETALQKLGHRVYDLRSMFENKHIDRWIEAARDWKEKDDLSTVEALLNEMEDKGYTATLDFPINLFAPAFAELRPEAKVLFSVRDSEEVWVESWSNVVWTLGCLERRPWSWVIGSFYFNQDLLQIIENFYWIPQIYPDHVYRPLPWFEVIHTMPAFSEEGLKDWIELHKKFQRKLEESIPEERLLIYNVKQGWDPLIPFLGIEDRELVKEDFPDTNDLKSLQIVRSVLDVIAIGLPLWILGFLYLCVRYLSSLFPERSVPEREQKLKLM
jgi:hypothetical protein